MYHDRDQDSECSPACTGCKCKEASHKEDDCRKKIYHTFRTSGYNTCYIFRRSKTVCHRFQCPCKNKNQDCRNHRLKSIRETCHTFIEFQHTSYQIQHDCDHKSKETSVHQSLGSITSWKCFYKTDSVKEPTGVDHSDHTADDQWNNRDQKIHYFSFTVIHCLFLRICIRSVRCGVNITFFRIIFMKLHRTILNLHHNHCNHHHDGKDCIEVIWNCTDKYRKSIFTFYKTGNGCCPRWNRCNDTYRSCCRIDQIRKLCSGNILRIRYRTHHASDCQTVKIVIDKDQHTKNDCCKLCTDTALDMGTCPFTECGRSSCLIHQADHGS